MNNNNKTFLEFTEFGKIEDVYNKIQDRSGLIEFVNNVVMNMDMFDENNNNGYGIMLKDLSNIYVLVSKASFPFNKLNSNQNNRIDLQGTKHGVVLGYIWLCPWKVKEKSSIPYHFINFIDSRITGLNIAKYMIRQYESESLHRCHLFPFEIMSGAQEYWKKYFSDVYNINNMNELKKMINDYHLTTNDIKWDNLTL